jgi:hypothetical protein
VLKFKHLLSNCSCQRQHHSEEELTKFHAWSLQHGELLNELKGKGLMSPDFKAATPNTSGASQPTPEIGGASQPTPQTGSAAQPPVKRAQPCSPEGSSQ